MTTAIILAGGLGTRLRHVVPDVPKPMAPVNGRPFLEHQMDYWIGQGVRRYILSVGYRREAIVDHFGESYRGVPVDYAIEDSPMGTGGGFLKAAREKRFDEPFLVLNGDTFIELDLAALRRFHAERRSGWTMSLVRAGESGRYMGMCMEPDGRIVSLRSGLGQTGGLVNGGAYLIAPDTVSRLRFSNGERISLEDDILPALAAAGVAVYGFECTGRFVDIGVPNDYFSAADILPR
ncbi:nucleotidyltransferase family protein [Trinickia caryophylli]|uniref:D-glycero-alpha-D-manno-heptose 1-phosphate guanylyltransferase n=1 Tax=Trinickia caryophylli TaxID=28094 RepID=A0A1X7CNF8_TRICW|nr:nucleotidyltransferase family protein [Trinickia caryophylli]PMS11265.1 phosphohexose mutase [Trinickia caryophylli]TRX20118.1 phosphohexose mutase [Trinickia caryophylli]WQE12531.1 nucleotidyltransferase family protein [Trinickia caryophylli]SME99923.1 D-glycero-alpha-D-manno-heptose 1-phosphate guanylyltransferase [Trinickia caryophylli]GLU30216.1 nucleoside-diphosphate-sugar pyrophosphorylase [Trinickia caryophylli]